MGISFGIATMKCHCEGLKQQMSTILHLWMPGSECSQMIPSFIWEGHSVPCVAPDPGDGHSPWCLFEGMAPPLWFCAYMCTCVSPSVPHVFLCVYLLFLQGHIGLRANFYMTSH